MVTPPSSHPSLHEAHRHLENVLCVRDKGVQSPASKQPPKGVRGLSGL